MEDLARWVERAARGEQEAFRELYRVFRPLVVRQARAFSSLEADDVEDVVQESFVRAFRGLPALRNRAVFQSWLLAIARNRALSHAGQKSNASRAREAFFHEVDEAVSFWPQALQVERDVAVVRELISELPGGPERETVELFYLEGELSARQIAERQGVGKSAVTMRLERFRARVKRELLKRVLAGRQE